MFRFGHGIFFVGGVAIVAFLPSNAKADDVLGEAFERAREIIRNYEPDPGPDPETNDRSPQSSTQQNTPTRQPTPQQRERDRIATNLAILNQQLSNASLRRPTTISRSVEPLSLKENRRLEIQGFIQSPPPPPEVLVSPETIRGVQTEGQFRNWEEYQLMLQRARERHTAILEGKPLRIAVKESPMAKEYPYPWYYARSAELVTKENLFIDLETEFKSIDPDLVRAIVWMESTHGYYDYVWPLKKTFLPMNIDKKYWEHLGYDVENPSENIGAGVRLLEELWSRTENPTIEKVASLYNRLGTDEITPYGKTVAYFYRTKPWTIGDRANP